MKIVIEGTPEECADAIRRLAPPQDIKPVFVPYERRVTSPFEPYIGDYPPPVADFIPWWGIDTAGTRITLAAGATEVTFPQSMCGTAVREM